MRCRRVGACNTCAARLVTSRSRPSTQRQLFSPLVRVYRIRIAGVCACAYSAPSCATWTRVPCARCATSGCRPTCRSVCAASPTRRPRRRLCAQFSSSTLLLPPLPPSDPTRLSGPSTGLECTAIACVCAYQTASGSLPHVLCICLPRQHVVLYEYFTLFDVDFTCLLFHLRLACFY